jgi:hypothetical protein
MLFDLRQFSGEAFCRRRVLSGALGFTAGAGLRLGLRDAADEYPPSEAHYGLDESGHGSPPLEPCARPATVPRIAA